MKRLLLLAGLYGFSAASALDLTPESVTRELEGGFRISILRFTHNGKTAEYKPPQGWKITGGGASLTLTPAEIPQAIAKITVVPRNSKAGDVATAGADLEKWIETEFLPSDALGIERTQENPSPFMLGPLPSKEYQFRYRRSTSVFLTSISVVDLNDKQRVVVEATSGAAHFEAVRDTMIGSLFSWEWSE